MEALGIDIGGTGIKGAPVDLATGKLLTERKKIATPRPATPDAVTEVVREVAQSFSWTGPVGATFPGVVTSGTIRTAANVDKSWIGTDAASMFGKALATDVVVLNDADAAGLAEMRFGYAAESAGTSIWRKKSLSSTTSSRARRCSPPSRPRNQSCAACVSQ